MNISHYIDKESNIIFVKAVGEISVHDLIEHEKKIIKDPDFVSGLHTLADFSGAIPTASVNYNTINISKDFVESIEKKRGKCKWAFIAPSDVTYGVCRMFQISSEGLSIETGVFRTEDEAIKWLQL